MHIKKGKKYKKERKEARLNEKKECIYDVQKIRREILIQIKILEYIPLDARHLQKKMYNPN